MIDKPRCVFCGRFISYSDLDNPAKSSSETVYTKGLYPEPDYDIFWHLECEKKKINQALQGGEGG